MPDLRQCSRHNNRLLRVVVAVLARANISDADSLVALKEHARGFGVANERQVLLELAKRVDVG
jgi:hypothetical protein